jgi:hypothetical protein
MNLVACLYKKLKKHCKILKLFEYLQHITFINFVDFNALRQNNYSKRSNGKIIQKQCKLLLHVHNKTNLFYYIFETVLKGTNTLKCDVIPVPHRNLLIIEP